VVATITRRMAPENKPYRVYRGGRRGPKLPSFSRPERKKKQERGRKKRQSGLPRSPARQALKWFGIVVSVFLLWLAAWSLAGYFSFRDGVKAANKRLPASAKRELSGEDKLLLTNPTTILLLGTDTRPGGGQHGLRHSDSIMLVRTDPDHHRLSYLSIPRDLWVDIPGYGSDRINTAYQIGGPALALKTVKAFTGLDVDHVVIVDFARFKELIDHIGGIDVNVPHPILSNRFDCPLDAAGCANWNGWRFEKGRQHMDGRRALVYSRIRENQLNPADNDITRGARQQQVTEAIAAKLGSAGTFLRLPFDGGDLLKPLATDLTAGDFLQLGWVKFRSDGGRVVHCRLGGDSANIGGASVISSSEDNRSVISMFTDESAPQPPNPDRGEAFPPGCVVGKKLLGPG
jgi:polyisoprenyl-teichoic acid--peptidoglycan teichoic acid transferase